MKQNYILKMCNRIGSIKAIFGPLILVIFISQLFVACDKLQNGQESEIIATVAGTDLTVDEALKNIPGFYMEQDSVHALLQYREQWIQEQLVSEHARSIGIHETETYQDKLEQLEKDLLETALREMILSENQDGISVSDEEAQQYYQNHREQFLLDERYVQIRHLTTRTRSDAENANRDLMNGIDWEVIVDNYSIYPDYQKEFSNQFWPVNMVLPEFPQLREYLSFIGISERSPITYENGNYHLLQLMEEKTEGEYPDLNWLIPQIKEWLKVEKSRRMVNGYLRNLYLQAESNNEIESADVEQLEQILNQHQFRNQ